MQVDQSAGSVAPFVLDILSLTNEARNAYGLRRQEYARYRHHCTQRLHRIRKTLGFTHGKDKSFIDRPIIADTVTDEKHLHLLLFQAERAWGYAMEIKALSVALDDPRKQQHYMNRLKKAAKCAEQLETICSAKAGKVDVRTALDAQAYAAVMSGYVLFEGQHWQGALEKFSAARAIYDKLSLAGTSHQEALCHAAMDEIDPNIRFCGYRLRLAKDGVVNVEELVKMSAANKGSGSDVLMREIENLIAQTRQEKAQDLEYIHWRSKTLPLRNSKLATAILAAQDTAAELNSLETSTSEAKLEQFDKVLQAYAEAEKYVAKALKEDAIAAAKVKSSKSEQNTVDLHMIATYISYSSLRHVIDRNLLLARDIYNKLEGDDATTDRNEDVQYQNLVKAYDNVVQNLAVMHELPGIAADLKLSAEVENKLLYYKSWRCFFTATAYSKLSRHAEAIALFDRAQAYATQIRSGLGRSGGGSASEPDSFNVMESELQEIESKIRGRKCQVHAAWYLENGQEDNNVEEKLSSMTLDEKTQDEPALIKRLDTYPPSITSKTNPTVPHLVDFPPALQPIPAKPLFFDIAFNYMDYNHDALAERSGHPKASQNESSSGGWFGSIWGRK
ncbi:signal recognition particle subunit srp68 [Mortierella polycephala]|uniref:Signal recognition particle subunit SRP68 n=1 Tax=Mortierella polycephala TaxID=41804 RepID=A0A9P6TVF1_9FUNG|nr:signal recognition particle subunit srp68 [Mortierella polycephala]